MTLTLEELQKLIQTEARKVLEDSRFDLGQSEVFAGGSDIPNETPAISGPSFSVEESDPSPEPRPIPFELLSYDDPDGSGVLLSVRHGGFWWTDSDGVDRFTGTRDNEVIGAYDLFSAQAVAIPSEGTEDEVWACLDTTDEALPVAGFFSEAQAGSYCKLVGTVNEFGGYEQYHTGHIDARGGGGGFDVRGTPELYKVVALRAYLTADDTLVAPATTYNASTMYLHATWDYVRVMP